MTANGLLQSLLHIIARKDVGEGVRFQVIAQIAHVEPTRLKNTIRAIVNSEALIVTQGAPGGNISMFPLNEQIMHMAFFYV